MSRLNIGSAHFVVKVKLLERNAKSGAITLGMNVDMSAMRKEGFSEPRGGSARPAVDSFSDPSHWTTSVVRRKY